MDASILGDPEDIHGHVTFEVTVPRGTQVDVVSIDEGAKVKVRYDKNKADTVEISVDIKTKDTYETKLVVTMDDQQLAEVSGTTDSPLEYVFGLP
jgi:predicted AAA+ superfamily ATPase